MNPILIPVFLLIVWLPAIFGYLNRNRMSKQTLYLMYGASVVLTFAIMALYMGSIMSNPTALLTR